MPDPMPITAPIPAAIPTTKITVVRAALADRASFNGAFFSHR